MASSREEIAIKLGIDSTAVMNGLNKVSGYLKQWINKRKSEEEAYTEWWKSELKQREDAETSAAIRSAQRSNEARRLWRQRAEARDARTASKNSEILGSNGAENIVAGGVGGFFAKGFGNSIKSFFKATLITAVIAAAYELVPTWEQIMKWWYGNDDEAYARTQKKQEELRTLREKRDDDEKKAADERHDEQMRQIHERHELESKLASDNGRRMEEGLRRQGELMRSIKESRERGDRLKQDRVGRIFDMSSLSLSAAAGLVDKDRGDLELGDFQFSEGQKNDIDQVRKLEHEAIQERINGNGRRAFDLTQKRLSLLKQMDWLSEIEQDPIKSIDSQMKEQKAQWDELIKMAKTTGWNMNLIEVKE